MCSVGRRIEDALWILINSSVSSFISLSPSPPEHHHSRPLDQSFPTWVSRARPLRVVIQSRANKGFIMKTTLKMLPTNSPYGGSQHMSTLEGFAYE